MAKFSFIKQMLQREMKLGKVTRMMNSSEQTVLGIWMTVFRLLVVHIFMKRKQMFCVKL